MSEETPEGELGASLIRLWEDQRKFNVAVNELDYKERSREEMIQVYLLGLMSEMDELLKGLNWKYHRKQDKPLVDRVQLADHLADIGKYQMCLWQLFGFSPEEAVKAMQKKTDALWHVLGAEFSEPRPRQPVLLVDLDNTVARYVEGLSLWMAGNGIITKRDPTAWGQYEMAPLYGLDWVTYQKVKLEWEQGTNNRRGEPGGYATLEPYDTWVEAVTYARKLGAYLVLCTARPTEGAKQVWYDCWSWGVQHFGKVDRLAFCGQDRVRIAQDYQVRVHPVVWLDDQNIELMRDYEIPSVVHIQPYNMKDIAPITSRMNIRCVGHSAMKYQYIKELLDDQQPTRTSRQLSLPLSDLRPDGTGRE